MAKAAKDELKQVILLRKDLNLPVGKAGAWRKNGAKKVVLKVADEKELLKYLQLAKDFGLKTALITDAGKTVIAPGTKTCVGIGPDSEEKIDNVTGELKVY